MACAWRLARSKMDISASMTVLAWAVGRNLTSDTPVPRVQATKASRAVVAQAARFVQFFPEPLDLLGLTKRFKARGLRFKTQLGHVSQYLGTASSIQIRRAGHRR